MSVEQKIHQYMSVKSCLFIKCCVVKSYNITNVVIKLQTQTTKTSSSPAAGTSGSDPTRPSPVAERSTVRRLSDAHKLVCLLSYEVSPLIIIIIRFIKRLRPFPNSRLNVSRYRFTIVSIVVLQNSHILKPLMIANTFTCFCTTFLLVFFKNQNSASFS